MKHPSAIQVLLLLGGLVVALSGFAQPSLAQSPEALVAGPSARATNGSEIISQTRSASPSHVKSAMVGAAVVGVALMAVGLHSDNAFLQVSAASLVIPVGVLFAGLASAAKEHDRPDKWEKAHVRPKVRPNLDFDVRQRTWRASVAVGF